MEQHKKLEQSNIKVLMDASWNLVKLDHVLLNYFIYFYELLKVPFFIIQ